MSASGVMNNIRSFNLNPAELTDLGSNVIASGALRAAKQSRVHSMDSGLLRRQEAPRNDGLMHLFLQHCPNSAEAYIPLSRQR